MASINNIQITDNSGRTLQELKAKAEVILEALGMHLEGEAKDELENSPRRIDTGLLRNSITHALSGKRPAITSYSANNPSRLDPKGAVPHGEYVGTAPEDPDNARAVYIGSNVNYAVYV